MSPEFRLVAHPNLRVENSGQFLVGGSPATMLRLTTAGTERVRAWLDGAPVADTPADRSLAERLDDRGMATPVLTSTTAHIGRAPSPQAVLVIPVHDDLPGLQATLRALDRVPSTRLRRIVIVDNGSPTPVSIESLPAAPMPKSSTDPSDCCRPEVDVVRTPTATGPADARNVGVAQLDEHVGPVAFVDAGVEVDGATIDELIAHLDIDLGTPTLAVAPRIVCAEQAGSIARFERRASPLDLGPAGGLVGPGRRLSYVPTACLVVAAQVYREGPTNRGSLFDDRLRYGEDVDLCWRLAEWGRVRYVPELVASHPARPTLWAFVKQRMSYGSAAGPLGRRHGEHITPLRTSPWGLAVAAAAFASRPLLALVFVAASTEQLRRRLPHDLDHRAAHAARLVGGAHVHTILAAAAAACRPWWPITAVLATLRPRAAARIVAAATTQRLFSSRRGSAIAAPARDALVDIVDPRQLALSVIDDVAYGTGVLRGSFRHRTWRPLLPVVQRSTKRVSERIRGRVRER